jgi:F-type H+-transporting ATPase subunit delta
MAHDPIAGRYAEALFDSAKAEDRVDETLRELTLVGELITGHPDLRRFLFNPDVDPPQKVDVFDRALKGGWSELARAFLLMVVSWGRSEHLPAIVEAFRAAVDAEQGRLRVRLRSAHPLPESVLARVRARIERLERKQVELEAEVDAELLGGLEIYLDHRVIDGSVRRQLDELRQQLSAVRVH